MSNDSVSRIKREQKQAFLFREISQLFSQLVLDEPRLGVIYPTRAELSAGEGMCMIYFYGPEGQRGFDDVLDLLKLYKPSMRRALAKARQSRHTPDLKFLFDETFEKNQRMQQLLEDIKSE